MKTIGNILWFVFGGFISGLLWLITGLLCCIAVVGIPAGMQCFKFARLSFWPFGKEVVYGGGAFYGERVTTLSVIGCVIVVLTILAYNVWLAKGRDGKEIS